MYNILNNLHSFIGELVKKRPLICTYEGYFFIECRLTSFVRKLFRLEEHRLKSLASGFRICLGETEKIPVQFSEIDNEAAHQPVDFQLLIKAGNLIFEQMSSCTSASSRHERAALKRAIVGLKYRLEGANGGLDPSPSSEGILDSLLEAAKDWKLSQPSFSHRSLSSSEILILQQACQYPEFVDILLHNPELLDRFLVWALRDRIDIRPFIEYPSLQKKINECELNGRIGRMGGKQLKIQRVHNQEDSILEKVVTLPFEGQDISILDEERFVLFRGNYALTVKEIFDIFKNKKYRAGNLEFMADGIINWNAHHWGWWDEDKQEYHKVDLSQDEWWTQLPTLEILSLQEAREKFGSHLDGRQWNLATIATRQWENLNFEGAHAYMSIAIPVGEGRYAVYPFGKYTFHFPSSLLKAFIRSCETTDATVAYPDENVFYTHRQKTRYSYALSEEQGRNYLELIKRDMLLSRSGNLVYQIHSDNCALWAQKKVEQIIGNVPNLFQMPFLDSDPRGFMAFLFGSIKALPKKWQLPVTLFLHIPLGAYRGKWVWENGKRIWRSLMSHEYWNDTKLFHPALLHKQQEEGILGRYVSMGVTLSGAIIRQEYSAFKKELVRLAYSFLPTIVKPFQSLSKLSYAIFNHSRLSALLEISSNKGNVIEASG